MAKAPTIVAGAASSNDSYSISEDQAAGGAVKLNVRLNDNAKSTLYSLDDLQSSDLLTQDGVLVPQLSRFGATIAITADGQVSYTNSSTQVQALAQGQSLQDSFLYAVRMQNGSLVWQTVTVTITGTNDAPVARADTFAVAEDALTTGSVAGNDSDVDNGAVLTFATTDQNPAGFTMASNGTWAFDGSNAAYQSLAAGQTQQFVVQYWVRDQFGASSSSTLTLTVTGRNDAPAAATASAGVTEDQGISGQLTATDADQASGLTFALNEAAPTGFTLNTNGSWTFDASSYDSSGEGETQTIQVRYAAVDSAGARGNAILTITVTGTNDGPVASPAAASVSESGSVSGAVSVTDADAGASYVVEPYYGAPDGFAMASDGNWTFDAAAAGYDWLGEGESQDVLIDYIVTDDWGDTSIATLTITVTGENDDPIANPATATVAEDDVISGQVVVSDPDASASLTVEPPMSYSVPGLEMLSDGSWTFDANQYEYQDLALGETRDILINYSVGDVEGGYDYSTLTVTVQGRNDAPVTTSQWVAGAEGQVSSGAILARDIDNGAQLTFAITGEAPAGLSLSADGSWTFDGTNPAWDHVAGGDTAFVFVPFTVTDEHGAFIAHTIVLAVEGSNDAPAVRVGAALPAGAEDTTYVVSPDQLLALWSDPDQGSQLYISEIAFSNGSIGVGSDSSYRYTPAANFNGTAFITMTVSDGLTSTTTQVPLTIAAINDPATVTGTRNGSVIEDQLKNPNALTGVVGDLNSVDPDGSADNDRWTVVTTPTVSSNGYGNFTISAAGVWNYRLDNGNATVEALNTGQTLSDSFTVYTIDGTAHVVTIVINGRTDFSFVAPELPGADPTDFDDLHAEFTQAGQVWATSGSPADDVYDGSALGDLISGSEGADTIYGHDGNDDIYGAAYFPNPGVYELGADTLYGQAGADWIEGGNGPDLIYGGSGNDRIEGDGYNGSLSNDRLYGGSGNDSIYGYGGDDLIVGGYGADSLSGGAGNDTFVYRSLLDVGDTISDYNQSGSGSDRLDLSAIDANVNVDGDQAFVWAGTAPAAYSLWSVVDGRMFGDVDGDPTTAELMIKIGYFIAPPPGIIY